MSTGNDKASKMINTTDPTRDPKCNRTNVGGKDEDYCSIRSVNILWAHACYLFRLGALLCSHDIVWLWHSHGYGHGLDHHIYGCLPNRKFDRFCNWTNHVNNRKELSAAGCHRPWYWRDPYPAKWCDSLKARRLSKQWQKLVSRSYSHSNRLMATRSQYVYMPRSMGNSYTEYPPPHWLKYPRYYVGISVYIWET